MIDEKTGPAPAGAAPAANIFTVKQIIDERNEAHDMIRKLETIIAELEEKLEEASAPQAVQPVAWMVAASFWSKYDSIPEALLTEAQPLYATPPTPASEAVVQDAEGAQTPTNYTEGNYRNTLPNGLTLVQTNPDCAVDLRGGDTHGWLYRRAYEPNGPWVTHRKLEAWEVMQAEDQALYGIVQHGTQVRAG